jgi:hypothetical protein
MNYVRDHAHEQYVPTSFWDDLPVYLQMTVEKIDLKSLFDSVCAPYHLPLTNISGWNDINARAKIMRRFRHWESRGKRIILLHCGDHDPGGLQISSFLRSNMQDMSRSVGWSPDNLEIERFGLNADFIRRHRLTWIDNLITGSGGNLADPRHPDHFKPYVQNYIHEFGARKVEANALVVRPEAGRKLCSIRFRSTCRAAQSPTTKSASPANSAVPTAKCFACYAVEVAEHERRSTPPPTPAPAPALGRTRLTDVCCISRRTWAMDLGARE